MTLLGLVGAIYVWITQADLVEGQQALSVAVPEFILITAIFVSIVVMSVALLGIIATALQMKENKDIADGKIKPGEINVKPAKSAEMTVPKPAPGSKEEREVCVVVAVIVVIVDFIKNTSIFHNNNNKNQNI